MADGRVFNFSAGPAAVPKECLEQAQKDMLNWNNSGMSCIECSHRGPAWMKEMEDTNARIRKMLNVPANFKIILASGGASLQFSAIPMNIIGDAKKVDFMVTGTWSQKGLDECKRLFPNVECNMVVPKPPANPTEIPDRSTWKVSEDAAYFYYCDNETIQGIEFPKFPDVPSPLVIDMSSNFLSKPITEWNKVGLIFACAQKNFGCAGVTVVIVREDLLERKPCSFIPVTLDYRVQLKADCMYNTPPTFPIYFANLVFKWVEKNGGVEGMLERNKIKAAKVYKAVDESPHFVNKVKPEFRSLMNVPFFRPDGYEKKDPDTDAKFINFAKARKIQTIKGHQSVGGFRASIYNACTDEAIDALIAAINEWTGF